MTIDEHLNRHAEWHGRATLEQEKQTLLRSMKDDLDGIYPLPRLRREVLTGHLAHPADTKRDWTLVLLKTMTALMAYQIILDLLHMYF